MTAPLVDEQDEQGLFRDIAKVRQRVTRLERRPAPASAAADAGGWPTWHRPLYGMRSLRNEDTTGTANWHTFADTTKYGTFKYQNSDSLGTTFYNGSVAYFGMYLGPEGSIWQLTFVYDQSANGCALEYKWATDPSTDGVPTDPATLSYYAASDSSLTMNGSPVTGNEEKDLSIMRINGTPGTMLTANTTGADATYAWADSMNGGPGLWWLRITVSDGGTSDYECVLREILVSRYTANAWVN